MKITQLLSDKPHSGIAIAVCFAILLALPWLHLLPADSTLHLSAYWVTLIGKIMCLALVALALDLVWGYAGILSLGHGLYFALGGYAFGMYLMRQSAGEGIPDFMRFLSWTEVPWFWVGTEYFLWSLALVVLVPGIIAFIFGFLLSVRKLRACISPLLPKPLPLLQRYCSSAMKPVLVAIMALQALKPF